MKSIIFGKWTCTMYIEINKRSYKFKSLLEIIGCDQDKVVAD